MDFMTSTAESTIGIRLLDCDHRMMSEALYDLNEELLKQENRNRIGSLLRKVARFNRNHFQLEESMMAATRYPGLALHRIHHKWLVSQMSSLIADYSRGGLILDQSSVSFLSRAHSIHVEKDDLDFGEWLNRPEIL